MTGALLSLLCEVARSAGSSRGHGRKLPSRYSRPRAVSVPGRRRHPLFGKGACSRGPEPHPCPRPDAGGGGRTVSLRPDRGTLCSERKTFGSIGEPTETSVRDRQGPGCVDGTFEATHEGRAGPPPPLLYGHRRGRWCQSTLRTFLSPYTDGPGTGVTGRHRVNEGR